MNEAEKSARISADNMILELLRTQHEMIKADPGGQMSGKSVGDFIAGLRDRLIEMYQKTPN